MRKIRRQIKLVLVSVFSVFLLVGLTACGGDSAPDPTPAPTPEVTATPAPTPTPTPEPQVDADAVYEEDDDHDEEGTIAGLWEWADDFTFRYTFNENGTGTRGFGAILTAFEWYADYETGYLDIYVPSVEELWSYIIYEGVLIIESLQVPGLVFAYAWTGDVEEGVDFDLAGIWSHVDEAGNIMAFDYVFFADGSGVRGSEVLFDIFYWYAYNGILEIYIPGMIEEWDFELSGDTLTILSDALPGVRLVYNRIG